MNTAQELAKINAARSTRDGQMHVARQYAGPWANGMKPGIAKKNVRKHVQNARKANHKAIDLVKVGKARPVSLVMKALMTQIETVRRHAVQYANDQAEKLSQRLTQCHGNIDVLAPEPDRRTTEWDARRRHERDVAIAYRAWVFRMTKRSDAAESDKIRIMDPEGVERFVKECIEDAEYAYITFVFKMDKKVGGNVVAARMHNDTNQGIDVWGYSYLIVTKDDGTEVIWHTRQITNRSKLGKYFPQWPSRIVQKIHQYDQE